MRYEKGMNHEGKVLMLCQRLCQFSIEPDVARAGFIMMANIYSIRYHDKDETEQ